MGGKWGSKKNGCRIGIFFDDSLEISGDGSQARVKNARIRFDSDGPVSESSNSWDWGGGAVTDGSRGTFSFSGSGARTVQGLTGQWVTLNYGSTKTANYNGSASGINYAGGGLSVSGSVTYPARAFAIPAIPTAMAAGRISDKQQQVSWALAPTSAAPITAVVLERQTNDVMAIPITVATLAGIVTSWVDSSTVANSQYRYRAIARNSAGDSLPSAWSPWVATTPSAPIAITETKAGTTVTVGWANTAPFRSNTPVDHSTNNGATYTAETNAAAGAVSYADTGLDVGLTHRYQLRHAITGVPLAAGGTTTLYSQAVQSVNVQLSAPPNAPLVTVPTVLDLAIAALVIAFTHQSTDSTAQTQAEVRYRAVGDPTWTTQSLTTQTSHTVPAGTLPNGVTYEVQARTRGENATFGAWSASSLVVGSGTPSLTVTGPVNGSTITTAHVTFSWSFYDPDGSGQASWEARLYDVAGNIVESAAGSGSTSSWTPQASFSDGATLTGKIRGRDATGLWSAWSESAVTADFLPPPIPDITADFDTENARVEIGVNVPPPVDGVTVEATSVTVERWSVDRWVVLVDRLPVLVGGAGMIPDGSHDGLYLTDGLELTGDPTYAGLYGVTDGMVESLTYPGLYTLLSAVAVSVTDPIPPLEEEVSYRVTAWSDADTSQSGTGTVATVGACGVFLNAGPSWTVTAKLKANVQIGYTPERAKVLRTFYGGITKEYPAEVTLQSWQASGDIATFPADVARIGGREPWAAIASMPAPVCIRSSLGHRGFGSISAVPQQSQAGSPHTGVSVTVSEVTHSE